MAFLAVISASQHLHAAKTDLITLESPSEALARCLHLAWRSVQYGFTHRLRDGKNHIYFVLNSPLFSLDSLYLNYDRIGYYEKSMGLQKKKYQRLVGRLIRKQ